MSIAPNDLSLSLINIRPNAPPFLHENGTTGGTGKKPDACYNTCPYGSKGGGFVPDWVPANPKIGLLFASPSKEDIVERKPLKGGMGRFFWGAFGSRLGLCANDFLVSHVLRCYVGWKYPCGTDVKRAERACRQWDDFGATKEGFPDPVGDSLTKWNPNLFIVTFSLDKAAQIGAFQSLVYSDLRKAKKFAEQGFRPLVVFGDEALALVAPWLTGSAKRWRGHWFEGRLEWARTEAEPKRGFNGAPTYKRFEKPSISKKAPRKEAKQLSMF